MWGLEEEDTSTAREGAPVRWSLTATEGPEGMALLPSVRLGAMSDMARVGRALARSCSPVRVYEDGRPLAHPNAAWSSIRSGKSGAYLLVSEGVVLNGSDGSDPRHNGRRYEVELIGEVDGCADGGWLHPGGTIRWQRRDVTSGAWRLILDGQVFGDGGDVHLVVETSAGPPRVSQPPLSALPLSLSLDHDGGDVQVAASLAADAGASVLWTRVDLRGVAE
jgi:hypothetical protein